MVFGVKGVGAKFDQPLHSPKVPKNIREFNSVVFFKSSSHLMPCNSSLEKLIYPIYTFPVMPLLLLMVVINIIEDISVPFFVFLTCREKPYKNNR